MNSLTIASYLISITVCANESVPQEPGRETPELAFATYKTSFAKEDWESLYSVLSPGYRNRMLFGAMFSLKMVTIPTNGDSDKIYAKYVDEQKVEKLEVASKQGLTTHQSFDAFAQAVKDKKGMFIESYTYLYGLRRNNPKEIFGPLYDLWISEDVATAKVKRTLLPGTKNEKEVTSEIAVYFIKVDGKWLFAREDEWRQRKTKKPESPESTAKRKE